MKAPLRTKSIGTKVSEEEFAALEECARQADMTLSEWVRAVLLAAPGVELPDDDAALAGRVTLAEVLALRTLFLNLQFRTSNGGQAQGPMTEAEMRGLIERADAVKGERARERIEAARSQTRKQAGVPADNGSGHATWFDLLRELKVAPVFLQGYWMDDTTTTIDRFADGLGPRVCIRLHGEDREGMEEHSGESWDRTSGRKTASSAA